MERFVMGAGNAFDGSSIEWIASSNSIAPGQSLAGFDFSSPDRPTALSGNSASHAGTPALTSFVYSGGPFSDAGFSFVVFTTPVQPPNNKVATSTSLASGAVAFSAVQLTAVALPLRIKPGKTGRAVIPLRQIPALAVGSYTVVAQLTDQKGGVSSETIGTLTITG